MACPAPARARRGPAKRSAASAVQNQVIGKSGRSDTIREIAASCASRSRSWAISTSTVTNKGAASGFTVSPTNDAKFGARAMARERGSVANSDRVGTPVARAIRACKPVTSAARACGYQPIGRTAPLPSRREVPRARRPSALPGVPATVCRAQPRPGRHRPHARRPWPSVRRPNRRTHSLRQRSGHSGSCAGAFERRRQQRPDAHRPMRFASGSWRGERGTAARGRCR